EIVSLLQHRLSVVSSCEELSYPSPSNEKYARKLDTIAKQNGVAVVGSGINPGFVMDLLPVILTAPCVNVRRMTVRRQINAAKRRIPFQRKVGIGLSAAEFYEAVRSGRISGHVGLGESISIIAESIGWPI